MTAYKISILITVFICTLSAPLLGQKKKVASHPQTDIIEILVKAFHISTKPKPAGSKRISFSVIPLSTSNSGGKRIFASSINAAFVLGQEDKTNFSTVFFLPYTDFSENKGFGLKYNIFTPRNAWNLTGETRISNLTQYAYGLGSSTSESDQFRLNFNNLRFNVMANKKIDGPIYGGVGLSFDRNFSVSVNDEPRQPGDFEKYGIGTQSSSGSTGIIFNLFHEKIPSTQQMVCMCKHHCVSIHLG
jgi:hypothetical protein